MMTIKTNSGVRFQMSMQLLHSLIVSCKIAIYKISVILLICD